MHAYIHDLIKLLVAKDNFYDMFMALFGLNSIIFTEERSHTGFEQHEGE